MIDDNLDMNQWKKDQLNYFRKYLNNFPKGSTQYRHLKQRIDHLEKLC